MNTSKRAVVLFTLSPSRENVNKISFSKINQKKLIDIFLQKIFCVINHAHRKTNFDLIISSDSSQSCSKEYFPNTETVFFEQKGRNFAERFESAIREAFDRSYEEVIILGNDCLDLTSDLLVDSFKKIESNDFVIGPAIDGGFYLLGLKSFESKNFDNIEWTTEKVFNQLLSNLKAEKRSYELLPELSDIDNLKDLNKWLKQSASKFCWVYHRIKSIITEPVQNRSGKISIIPQLFFTQSCWNRPPPAVCR